jgi:hypothetical protein
MVSDALSYPGVAERIAHALFVENDNNEAGRIIREAVGVAIADWREVEAMRAEESAYAFGSRA